MIRRLGFALFCLAACAPKAGDGGSGTGDTGADGSSEGTESGGGSGGGDDTSDGGQTGGGDTSDDGDTSGGETSSGGGSGVIYPGCEEAVPEPMPVVPAVNKDAGNRPLFDYWRDYDCEDVGDLYCTSGDYDCQAVSDFDECFAVDFDGEEGVCAYMDGDSMCDGEGEAMGWQDGACYGCVPVESHAAACCAGIDGVDCRSWPFPGDGKPGMICARHEDCEEGLLCGPPAGGGYGICQCPELYGTRPDTGPDCWRWV